MGWAHSILNGSKAILERCQGALGKLPERLIHHQYRAGPSSAICPFPWGRSLGPREQIRPISSQVVFIYSLSYINFLKKIKSAENPDTIKFQILSNKKEKNSHTRRIKVRKMLSFYKRAKRERKEVWAEGGKGKKEAPSLPNSQGNLGSLAVS